eukprot:ANDGO_03184.mRNA.1 hypothetical protein AK88_02784
MTSEPHAARELQLSPQLLVSVLSAAVVLLLTVWILQKFFQQKSKPTTTLIVGPCGSGKTTLFYAFTENRFRVRTVMSMAANAGRFAGTANAIVDIPGHPRVRSKYLAQHFGQAKTALLLVNGDLDPASQEFRDHIKEFVDSVRDVQTVALASQQSKMPRLIVGVRCEKDNDDAETAKSSQIVTTTLKKTLQDAVDRELSLREKSDAESKEKDFPALSEWVIWSSSEKSIQNFKTTIKRR